MSTPTKLLLPKVEQPKVTRGEYAKDLETRMQQVWAQARKYAAVSKEA